MKKIALLILGLISMQVIGQNNYEAFQYENKFGVVEINTLNEFIAPSYSSQNDFFIPITLIDYPEYTFINRTTGEKQTYTTTNEELRFNGMYYMHFYKSGKSVFISRDTKSKITLNKEYRNAIGNGNDLMVQHNGLYEVYAEPNFKTPKVKNIKAKKVFTDFVFRKRTQKIEYVNIFYGNDAVYVYDKKYNLLKKYPSKVEYESRMFDVIAGEFTEANQKNLNGYGIAPRYFTDEFKNGYTTFKSIEYKKAFKIKGEFRNSNIYDTEDCIILTEKQSGKKYSFKIDFEKKRFLLPLKYQELLELTFVE